MDLSGSNVLVTGADGFIGSHLVEMLLRKECRVRALAQYNSFNNWGWLEDVETTDNLEVVTGDVRDPFYCNEIIEGIDIVFHLAALIAIPYSYVAPASYVDTNIQGTVNICRAAQKSNCSRVIHTSTSEVYGTAQYVPIDEKHPLQPQSPYSASKIAADAMAMSFYNSFDLPLTIARPFNTYGPRQSARAVIPTIITQIAAGKRKIKLGALDPTRDFNYVLDTCGSFVALAENDEIMGKAINLGTGKDISIGNLADMISNLMESDVEFVADEQRIRPEKSEVLRLCCDNTQLRELTGYTSEYSLERGLKETIGWFCKKENMAQYKANIYNV